jgi:DNA-binding transcriptional MerR regulator
MRFTIEAVSKMTGIPAASLRNWEKRYGFPRPERQPSGHRFYSPDDVDFLKRALVAINEGQCLTFIAELYLKEKCGGPCSEPAQSVATLREAVDDISYRVELIYNSLMNFDQTSILQHYLLLNAKLSPEQMFDRVFQELFRRLGRDWVQGKVSMSQEHFISAFLKHRLSSFLVLDFPPSRGEKILAAMLENEKHEGGLMLVSAHLKFRGYPVVYIGSDLPAQDLSSLVDAVKPKVVCLSYSLAIHLERDLEDLNELPVLVCIGGMASFDLAAMERLAPRFGANIKICKKGLGSEAADFVEMVCQST